MQKLKLVKKTIALIGKKGKRYVVLVVHGKKTTKIGKKFRRYTKKVTKQVFRKIRKIFRKTLKKYKKQKKIKAFRKKVSTAHFIILFKHL